MQRLGGRAPHGKRSSINAYLVMVVFMPELFPLAFSSRRVHMHEFAFAYACVNDPEFVVCFHGSVMIYVEKEGELASLHARTQFACLYIWLLLYTGPPAQEEHGTSLGSTALFSFSLI